MTYLVAHRSDHADLGGRLMRMVARVRAKHAGRSERVRARRSALAMSEEARINAQMRYRRMRYRHMAA